MSTIVGVLGKYYCVLYSKNKLNANECFGSNI